MSRHLFIKERIVTLFFHGTRKATIPEYVAFENELSNVLKYIQGLIQQRNHSHSIPHNSCDDFDNAEYGFYLQTIFRMILHTRNVDVGKGERNIAYCMVYAMYLVYPEKARQLLDRFVINEKRSISTNSENAISAAPSLARVGGWMDMKKMADYVYIVKNQPTTHPLIRYCILLTNTELYIDNLFVSRGLSISDVAAWIPREKSAYAWFFRELANDWGMRHNSFYFTHAKTTEQMQGAIRKNTTQYRKMISRLSKKCVSPKPLRTLSQFVGDAIRLLENGSAYEIDQLNRDWTEMIQTHEAIQIGNVLPILDISLSMKEHNETPLRTAIGVACFLLEKTTIDKRIMTIDQTPSWIVIPQELSFVATVSLIRQIIAQNGGTNKNVFRTMDVLASSFSSSMGSSDTITIVVISDMKFTHFRDTSLHFPIDEYIRSCFLTVPHSVADANANVDANADANAYATHFCPHITYWNVGTSKMYPAEEYALPCDYDRSGSTVVSGDVGNVAQFILPEWYSDSLQNQCHMVANTPFDAMCSVLSFVS